MDIRIEKTKQSIINAFIEIRSRKEVERITVKELCEKARINKSTFYAHYKDIYDLSDQLETELVDSIMVSYLLYGSYYAFYENRKYGDASVINSISQFTARLLPAFT